MTNEEWDRKFDEIAASHAKTAAAQAVIATAQAENNIAQAEINIAQAENAKQLKKTEEILKNMGIHVGGMANSLGQSTEEYFYNSLFDDRHIGNIKFDEISKNLHGKIPNLEDEFDITMFNGLNIALIECKYRATESDVLKLIEKKVGNFKKLFPFYANHNFYLGIASFSFDERVEKFAKENGVAILRQKGDVVEIDADNLKVY